MDDDLLHQFAKTPNGSHIIYTNKDYEAYIKFLEGIVREQSQYIGEKNFEIGFLTDIIKECQ